MSVYLEAYGLVLSVGMNLGHEGGAESGFAELVELIIDEPEEDAALAHAGITHHDDLYLR